MINIIDFLKSNWLSISALLISMFSLIFSFKRFKGQLATISKDFAFERYPKTFRYKAKITLKNVNEQIEIVSYKLFKKERLLYREYQLQPTQKIEIKYPTNGEQILNLQYIVQDLPKGRYKLVFYLNREPQSLKLLFGVPFDHLLKNHPLEV